MIWKIKILTDGIDERAKQTLIFAAEELKKYLQQCISEQLLIIEGGKRSEGAICLGVNADDRLPAVEDAVYDDAILLDIKGQSGLITGTNARSVLIGVYRYLRELGYTFVRPGKEGEKHPAELALRDVLVLEQPSYRHRTVCIEGSVFYESVADMIDWLPKVGMNGYYTQFFTPWIFFKRWYQHKCYEFTNPYLAPEPLEVEDVEGFTRMYEREIFKRGLLYMKVGHGWTCDPFGMTSLGWESVDPETIPKGIEKYLAMLDGKRAMHDMPPMYVNVPMVTQLCYGNPEVRRTIVDHLVDYCKQNPNIDILGFALADGSNAYCECELCRHLRPSDFKVMLLNEIDRRLSAEGIRTRVDFAMYVDTLWTPIQEKLPEDQSRLLLSFCPISRSYTQPFPTSGNCEIREFVYNKLTFPQSVEEFLPYMTEWRKHYHGEMAAFDYYYMWDCYKDLGMTETARVIQQDIRNYRDLEINGLISCQGQRVFCPTSLGMNLMARTLWDRDCDFDAVRNEVFAAEFGADYALVRDYLQDLSIYSLPEVTRMEKPLETHENTMMYEACLARVRGFEATINAHLAAATDECEKTSWQYLKFHSELSTMLMTAFKAMSEGAEPAPLWAPIEDFVNRREWEMRQYFDVFEFKYTYGRLFPVIKKNQKDLIIGI